MKINSKPSLEGSIYNDQLKLTCYLFYELPEIKSPYGIDRFILEILEKEGFIFDRNRSQYIKYCFGIYNGMK